MKLKFKKLHHSAVIPSYAKEGDAGLDLTATGIMYDDETGVTTIKTDLAVEIPEGHVGLLFPRSSIFKTPYRLSNAVGVIDSGYRGEIMFKFDISTGLLSRMGANQDLKTLDENSYQIGDRVGQLIVIPYPKVEIEEVKKLSDTERGTRGHGSSGR